MRWGLGSVLLVAIGCSRIEQVSLTLPEVEGARSFVVALERDTVLSAYVFDSGSGALRIPAPEGRDEFEIELLAYEESLTRLGLTEGALVAADTGAAMRPIPTPKRVFTSTAHRDVFQPWTEARAIRPLLGAERIAEKPCARFLRSTLSVPNSTWDPRFMISLGPDSALLGTTTHLMFRVGRDRVEPISLDPALLASAAAFGDDGKIWLGGENGEIWRAQLNGLAIQVTRVGTASVGSPILGIAGTADELFLLTGGRSFERFDGTRSTTLHRLACPPSDPSCPGFMGRLLRVRAGLAIANVEIGNEVATYVDGAVSVAHLENTDHLYGMADVPGVGTLLAGKGGVIWIRDAAGVWVPLLDYRGGSPPVIDFPKAIIPFDEGFLWAGRYGQIAQLRNPSRSFCPSTHLFDQDIVTALLFGAGALFVEGRSTDGTPSRISLVTAAE